MTSSESDNSPGDNPSNLYKSELFSWKRNLIFISIAQFFAMVGMSSVIPFMPLFVKELGITSGSSANIWSSLIFAGPYFLAVIATPVWGALGDKYGRKLMIIRSVFGLCIAVFLMGFVQNVEQLLFLRIFQGAVSGMIAAALTFVSANTPTEKSGYAIGIMQSSLSAGNIVGPFAGGLIADFSGIRSVFFIVSILLLISGILVVIFVKESHNVKLNLNDNSILNNLKYINNNHEMRFILILIIISQAGINYTNPIFPYYIESLKAPKELLSTITGSLLAVVGLMSIIFAPVWGKRGDKKDYKKTVKIASFIISIAAFAHVLVTNYIYLYPVRAIAGIFFAAMLPSLYTALNRISPSDNKGGIIGIASSANLAGTLTGYISCGYIASIFGLNSTFIISGGLMLAVSVLIFKKGK